MLINIIKENAEQALLSAMERGEQRHTLRGVLHFRCAKLGQKLQEEKILLTVRPLLQDKQAVIYFFHDGDLAIAWNGGQKSLVEDVRRRLYVHFRLNGNEALHTYYDCAAHGEDLRLMLKEKIKSLPDDHTSKENADSGGVFKPAFTDAQIQHIKKYAVERRTYEKPTILIVEDQEFSRKLLGSMLDREYVSYSAPDAEQAIALYAEHVPCITFLDVELPDANGHDLAAFIKQYDPESFVVMVTANNYQKDVALARKNNVQGFIAKPYSKQKIMDAIQKFMRDRIAKARRYP